VRIHEVDAMGRNSDRDSQADLQIRLRIPRDHPLLSYFVEG